MKLTETEPENRIYEVFGGPQNVYHLNSCTESIGGQGGNNFVFFPKKKPFTFQHFGLNFANRIKQCSCYFILLCFPLFFGADACYCWLFAFLSFFLVSIFIINDCITVFIVYTTYGHEV